MQRLRYEAILLIPKNVGIIEYRTPKFCCGVSWSIYRSHLLSFQRQRATHRTAHETVNILIQSHLNSPTFLPKLSKFAPTRNFTSLFPLLIFNFASTSVLQRSLRQIYSVTQKGKSHETGHVATSPYMTAIGDKFYALTSLSHFAKRDLRSSHFRQIRTLLILNFRPSLCSLAELEVFGPKP